MIDGMSVIGEGVDARRRQRRLQRRAPVPRRDAAGRSAAVLMPVRRSTARRSPRSTAPAQFAEVLGLSEHLRDALWRVDSAGARPVDATGGVIVAGMGGSASGGAPRRRRARFRLRRPMWVSDGYALPGWAGPSTLVFVLELLRRHRGDARRRTTRPWRAARRGSCARPAAGWPSALAREGVPVVPLPGGFQPRAAIGYSLVVALEAARAGRRRAVVRDEIEAAAALADGARRRVGPGRRRGQRGEVDRPGAARDRSGDRRRRARGRGRLSLEVPVQRERRAARVRVACCPRPATTRSSAGTRRGRWASSPTSRSRTPPRTRATRCGPS